MVTLPCRNAPLGERCCCQAILAPCEPESLLSEVVHLAVDLLDSEDEFARGSSPDIEDYAASARSVYIGSRRENTITHTPDYAGVRQGCASP